MKSARVLITAAGLLILSACSGGDEPQSAPTIKDRAPSTQSESTSEVDGSGASSSESEEPVYENAQDVIVDENGRRSFPTQTAEQTLDMQWEFFIANIDGGVGCVKNLEQSLVFFFFHAAVAARSFSWSCQVWTGVR